MATNGGIVHWKPKHDLVVALHMMGYQNIQIAELTGYSDSNVSTIIKDPRTKKAILEGRRRYQEDTVSAIQDMLVDQAYEGMKKLGDTIDGEFKLGSDAKKHQDVMTLKLIDRVGFSPRAEAVQGKGGIQLDPESSERLVSALEKANTVREIVDMPETGVEVVYDSHKTGKNESEEGPES